MTKQEFLNRKYLALCQQLGDAQIKLDQLTEHISHLKSQIKSLNDAFPLMTEFDHISRTASQKPKNAPHRAPEPSDD